MKTNLAELSRSMKKEADYLLKKTGLLDDLARFGTAAIMGSYSLDLMVDGDIDVYLVDKSIDKQKSLEILNFFIEQGKFDGYLYYDHYKKKRPRFPRGYYIGLKTRFKGRKWKIDLWLMDKMDKPSERFLSKVAGQLDERTRKTILTLKHSAKTTGLDIPSYLIYRAVLEDGVKSLVGLRQ